MNFTYRIVLFPAVIALVLILSWQVALEPAPETDIHLGIWTCDSEPPGNRLHFWFVDSEVSTSIVRVLDGQVKVVNLFGEDAAEGQWNFGYFEPLIVNLNVGNNPGFIALRKIDDDHLLLRYSTDCDALLQAPFDHPDVLHFRRVQDEAENTSAA